MYRISRCDGHIYTEHYQGLALLGEPIWVRGGLTQPPEAINLVNTLIEQGLPTGIDGIEKHADDRTRVARIFRTADGSVQCEWYAGAPMGEPGAPYWVKVDAAETARRLEVLRHG